MYVDGAVVALTLIAFKDWALPLLSLIIIFITGKVIDIVLEGMDYNKAVLIISKKHEEIKRIILKDIDRGGTYIPIKGMYENKQNQMIFSVLTRREVEILKEYVAKIDTEAFVTIFDAKEILGKGFRPIVTEK